MIGDRSASCRRHNRHMSLFAITVIADKRLTYLEKTVRMLLYRFCTSSTDDRNASERFASSVGLCNRCRSCHKYNDSFEY